jgi:hypothetical protein
MSNKSILLFTVLSMISFQALATSNPLLPDLITSPSPLLDRRIDEDTIPGRKLLRFSNATPNIGRGKLELHGGKILEDGTQEVFQRIYFKNGNFISRLAGVFIYHPEHHHIHFNDYAAYRLRKVRSLAGVGEVVASSEKVSFCIRDSVPYNPLIPGFRFKSQYSGCEGQIQGLGVGQADFYQKNLPGQWIDITDIPTGRYWIESEVDPFHRIKESNELNNVTRTIVNIE